MDVALERYRLPITIGLVAIILLGGAVLYSRLPPTTPLVIVEPTPAQVPGIKVYVTGAVNQPGVYTLSPQQRVEDALAAAGGAASNASLEKINLAAKLRDEMKIDVPRIPMAGATASLQNGNVSVSSELLDLNSASKAELEALPGIGPVTADKILTYRAEHGGFRNVEELLDAKVMSRSTFEKVKGLVTVR